MHQFNKKWMAPTLSVPDPWTHKRYRDCTAFSSWMLIMPTVKFNKGLPHDKFSLIRQHLINQYRITSHNLKTLKQFKFVWMNILVNVTKMFISIHCWEKNSYYYSPLWSRTDIFYTFIAKLPSLNWQNSSLTQVIKKFVKILSKNLVEIFFYFYEIWTHFKKKNNIVVSTRFYNKKKMWFWFKRKKNK